MLDNYSLIPLRKRPKDTSMDTLKLIHWNDIQTKYSAVNLIFHRKYKKGTNFDL